MSGCHISTRWTLIASSRRRSRSRRFSVSVPESAPHPLHPPRQSLKRQKRQGTERGSSISRGIGGRTSPARGITRASTQAPKLPTDGSRKSTYKGCRVRKGASPIPHPVLSYPIPSPPPCSHANSLGFAVYRACMHRQDGISRFSVPDALRLGSGHLPPRRMAQPTSPRRRAPVRTQALGAARYMIRSADSTVFASEQCRPIPVLRAMLPGPPVAVDIIAHGGSASRHAAEDLPARSGGKHGRSRNQRCGCGQGIPTQWRRPCLAVRSPLPWFCFVRVPIHLSSAVAIHDETVQPHLQLVLESI